jgi:hypothetical protein
MNGMYCTTLPVSICHETICRLSYLVPGTTTITRTSTCTRTWKPSGARYATQVYFIVSMSGVLSLHHGPKYDHWSNVLGTGYISVVVSTTQESVMSY